MQLDAASIEMLHPPDLEFSSDATVHYISFFPVALHCKIYPLFCRLLHFTKYFAVCCIAQMELSIRVITDLVLEEERKTLKSRSNRDLDLSRD